MVSSSLFQENLSYMHVRKDTAAGHQYFPKAADKNLHSSSTIYIWDRCLKIISVIWVLKTCSVVTACALIT